MISKRGKLKRKITQSKLNYFHQFYLFHWSIQKWKTHYIDPEKKELLLSYDSEEWHEKIDSNTSKICEGNIVAVDKTRFHFSVTVETNEQCSVLHPSLGSENELCFKINYLYLLPVVLISLYQHISRVPLSCLDGISTHEIRACASVTVILTEPSRKLSNKVPTLSLTVTLSS